MKFAETSANYVLYLRKLNGHDFAISAFFP
jgi:hypothetical protein